MALWFPAPQFDADLKACYNKTTKGDIAAAAVPIE
jgi:hypothetical protein